MQRSVNQVNQVQPTLLLPKKLKRSKQRKAPPDLRAPLKRHTHSSVTHTGDRSQE